MDKNAIMEKARRMIQADAKKDAHIIKERQMDRAAFNEKAGRFGGGIATEFDNIMSSYSVKPTTTAVINESQYVDDSEDRLYQEYENKMAQYNQKQQMNENAVAGNPFGQMNMNSVTGASSKSKLPKEILESFSKNYIDESALDPRLANLGNIELPKQKVAEQKVSKPIETKQSNGVDYEIIKSIVESSVKKYMGALSKKLLNEAKQSNNNGIAAIQFLGDKFSFIMKNGDLYEATLKFKQNLNENKKSNQ
jgi:glutamyl-tRNA reductase